ncbi:hypothetical protein [Streptomyces nigrescens]|uniref:hypothetical protein n=1 Tax=Streptomyces nigrescens TaxID=1920 RepID=UPI0036FBEB48
MPTPDNSDDVQWFGWEIHCEEAHSDKFYRFMVTLQPTPAAIGLHGRRGSSGNIGLLETGGDAQDVIRKVIDRTRNKENRRYNTLTRGFTTFTAPASLSDPASLRENAHILASHFGLAAVAQGTEEGECASIPTRPL